MIKRLVFPGIAAPRLRHGGHRATFPTTGNSYVLGPYFGQSLGPPSLRISVRVWGRLRYVFWSESGAAATYFSQAISKILGPSSLCILVSLGPSSLRILVRVWGRCRYPMNHQFWVYNRKSSRKLTSKWNFTYKNRT